MSRSQRRLLGCALTAGVASLCTILTAAPAASGSPARTVGVIRPLPAVGFGTTQSNNWSGYNQGYLDTRHLAKSVSGQWTVPTARQHTAGQDEYSATWTGIGGGCVDANCSVTDNTLIQAGTEQDVAADGTPSYSTWYELIPAPALSAPVSVRPGDVVSVSITQVVPGLWKITIANLTTGQSWSKKVPYTSTYTTAEWIEETPIIIGGGGAGLSAMPDLGTVNFDASTVNGVNAGLKPSQEIQLVDPNGAVLATPSAPDGDTDGFNDCTYSTSCPPPTSS